MREHPLANGIVFNVGLCPNIPHNAAGNRIEPPISPPNSNEVNPTHKLAADPPLDPPGVHCILYGLDVVPYIGLYVCTYQCVL